MKQLAMKQLAQIIKLTKWSMGLILFLVSACTPSDKIEVTRQPVASPTPLVVAQATQTASPSPSRPPLAPPAINTHALPAEELVTPTSTTPAITPSPTARPTDYYTPIPTLAPTSTPLPIELTLTAQPTVTPSPTIAFAYSPLPAAETVGTMELVGQLGGYVSAVIARGPYLYLAAGPRLLILDVSNPTQPVFVGQSEVLAARIDAMAVNETHAYVVTQNGTLHLINITTPASPRLEGSLTVEEVDYTTEYRAIVVVEQRAYLVIGRREDSYLSIIDSANPAQPVLMATYQLPTIYAEDVAVMGNFVYVAAHEETIILDAADVAQPIEVARVPGVVRRLTVAGDYLYLASGEDGLRIFDVTNPASPRRVATYRTDMLASQVTVAGNYAYVSDNFGTEGTRYVFYQYGPPLKEGHLEIVDITTPSAPVEIGRFDTDAQIWNLAIQEGYAYLATGDLSVVDLRVPASPTVVGSYEMIGEVWDAAANGPYAYLAAGNQGLFTLDMNDPAAPLVTSHSQPSGHARLLAADGNYLYMSNNFRVAYFDDPENPSVGVRIFDASNQAAPVETGYYEAPAPIPSVIEAFTAVDNTLYLVLLGSLETVQTHGPATSLTTNSYRLADYAPQGVAIAENYAYVTGNEGLVILDMTNPAEPITVSVGFTGYDSLRDINAQAELFTGSILVSSGYAYIDCLHRLDELGIVSSVLCVVDVRNPAAPSLVAVYDLSGGATRIGERIYVTYCGAYYVFDAAAPSVISEMIRFPQNPWGCGGAISGDYMYHAAGASGLYIFRVTY